MAYIILAVGNNGTNPFQLGYGGTGTLDRYALILGAMGNKNRQAV